MFSPHPIISTNSKNNNQLDKLKQNTYIVSISKIDARCQLVLTPRITQFHDPSNKPGSVHNKKFPIENS